MSAPAPQATDYRPAGPLRLVVALASGPAWWGVHLGLTYLVIPETCALEIEWVLHVITAATALGCAVGGWVSAGILRGAGPCRERDRYARRDGYLGWIGLALSVFFLAVTLMEGMPAWFLSPCW